MAKVLTPLMVLVAWLIAAGPSAGAEPVPGFERVAIPAAAPRRILLAGYFARPEGDAPVPAVIALHGCGGLFNTRGRFRDREADWATRLVGWGYAVLFLDSFGPRAVRQICTLADRPLTARDRAADAAAAVDWLIRRPGIAADRIALLGWSHGAMSLLWAVGEASTVRPVKTAIAFYPGCREVLRVETWRPNAPVTLLLGANDDWTAPAPCQDLARKFSLAATVYPGAFHGFDAPNSPVRVRKGLSAPRSGEAHVGTNPEARAAAIREVERILAEALRR